MNEYQQALLALNRAAYAALKAAKGKDDKTRAELMALAHASDNLVDDAE